MRQKIINCYRHLSPGTQANLLRVMGCGSPFGVGKFMIFDTDFACTDILADIMGDLRDKYAPSYYFSLANKIGFSGIMGNLGVVEDIAASFPAEIPLILRLNSSNYLDFEKIALTKAISSSVKDAVRIGASAVCFTVYVSSSSAYEMLEDLKDIIPEAHESSLPVIVEICPKGGLLSKAGENTLDTLALAVRVAVEFGGDIIKTVFPSEAVESPKATGVYKETSIDISNPIDRVNHLVTAAFNGRRVLALSTIESSCDKVRQDLGYIAESACLGFLVSSSLGRFDDREKAVSYGLSLAKAFMEN